ncbi:MAG: hypothetical protein AAB855_04925 [Patescibacteria group bacterium]|mgnify:CR=1 FL=1
MPLRTSSSVSSSGRSNVSRGGHVLAKLTLVTSALSFIAALLVMTVQASALTVPLGRLQNAGNVAWGTTVPKDIGTVVGNIIFVILGLLGVIFVILLTYSGFLWLTSAGEEEKVKKAQGLIVNSIIGVFIVIAAYTIAWFVLTKLAGAV